MVMLVAVVVIVVAAVVAAVVVVDLVEAVAEVSLQAEAVIAVASSARL